MKNSKQKTLVIGLDGVEPTLLYKLVQDGKLPNLTKIIKKGVSGKLESSIPPLTAVAWPSFMTGKNPGKFGIFDFIDSRNKKFPAYNFKSIKSKSLWKILSENKRRVCVVAVPITYPPEEVNGILISGLDTPDENTSFTYPPELKKELKEEGYRIWIDKHLYKKRDILPKKLISSMHKRAEVAINLMQKEEWDFFMVVFNETDVFAHFCGKKLAECYKEADKVIGKFLDLINEKTNLILMSDHGNISYKGVFYTNKILKDMGLLKLRGKKNRVSNLILSIGISREHIKDLLERMNLDKVLKFISPRVKRKIPASRYTLTDVDWNKTKAYATGYGIYLTEDDNEVRKSISDKFNKLSEDYEFKLYKKEEIYSGPYLDKAPDFVIVSDEYEPINAFEESSIIGPRKRSGDPKHHSMYGIFIAQGPEIKKNKEINAKIIDLAPTILHIMNVPIPKDMDGRVLKEIFKKDSELGKREVVYEGEKEGRKIKEQIKKLKSMGRI